LISRAPWTAWAAVMAQYKLAFVVSLHFKHRTFLKPHIASIPARISDGYFRARLGGSVPLCCRYLSRHGVCHALSPVERS
jgi:hypothetical protein